MLIDTFWDNIRDYISWVLKTPNIVKYDVFKKNSNVNHCLNRLLANLANRMCLTVTEDPKYSFRISEIVLQFYSVNGISQKYTKLCFIIIPWFDIICTITNSPMCQFAAFLAQIHPMPASARIFDHWDQ